MQSQPRAGCHQLSSWDRSEWSLSAVSALSCCQQPLLRSAHISRPHLCSEKMESLWDPERTSMQAEENRGGFGGELITHKAKRQERKRQELLALALGVKLGSKGTLLWKPIKLLASCPQISSPLVRRIPLKDTPEKQCPYEKIHNFKVSSFVLFIHLNHSNVDLKWQYSFSSSVWAVLKSVLREAFPDVGWSLRRS